MAINKLLGNVGLRELWNLIKGHVGNREAVLNARMDTFTHLDDGSTTGDAELADIRVGYDGLTYESAGGAVRGQVSNLKSALGETTRNLFDIENWSSSNNSMVVSDGVASNILTDSRSLILYVTTRSNGSTVDTVYSASETVRHRKHTFIASGDADIIRFTASGQTVDIRIDFKGLSILEGTTYTLSYDIIGAATSSVGGFKLGNIQLELGSSQTEYIPHITAHDYIARKDVSNLDDVTDNLIDTTSQNLVDKNNVLTGAIITPSNITSSSSGRLCLTKLVEGEKYVFYRNILDNRVCRIGFAKSTALYSEVTGYKNFCNTNTIVNQNDADYPYVFTVPDGYPYFAIQFYFDGYEPAYTAEEILNSLYIKKYDDVLCALQRIGSNTGCLNPIYDIFSNEISSVSNEIIDKSTSKALLLGIITDTHIESAYDDANKVSMTNMKKVNDNVSFDVVINMGDLIDGGEDKATERNFTREGMKRIIGVGAKRFAALVGNHDNNGLNPSALFTDTELYGMMLRMNETEVVRHGITNNAYIDYPHVKIRLVFVDSVYQTAGFSQSTIDWVDDVLTNLPAGYKVVFISHEPTRWSLISTSSGNMVNSAEMESVLTEHESVICGWIHGHTHFDNVSYVMTFPEISITCGKPQQYPSTRFPSGASAPERTIGDITQDAWDAVLVLPEENKFELVRFGAGSSRTVSFRQ